MKLQVQRRHVGDTESQLTVALVKEDKNGVDQAVPLTGKTVEFMMLDEDDFVHIAPTTSGVSVPVPADGEVNYQFTSGQVQTSGEYYGYFIVDGIDTFPVIEKNLKIIFYED